MIERIARDRDRDAFGDLYDAIAGNLNGYARRLGLTHSDAQELVQETLLTIWRRAAAFDPAKAGVYTWSFTILRNKRTDMLRKDKLRAVSSDDLWQEYPAEKNRDEGDLNARFVRNLLKDLPDEQRQILYNVYFEGKSHSVVAEERDMPLGSVKSSLRLAINRLKKLTQASKP